MTLITLLLMVIGEFSMVIGDWSSDGIFLLTEITIELAVSYVICNGCPKTTYSGPPKLDFLTVALKTL